MAPPPVDSQERSHPNRRRRLRAAFAADVASFSRMVSLDESGTLDHLGALRAMAREELARFEGWLFGMPGDGIFALFESAVDAVACGLSMQARISASPDVFTMRIRVGVHLGDVLFDGDMPFGETLAIAARLEALADPGGMLVSQSVRDAVAPRIRAVFDPRGAPTLKNIDRPIEVYAVTAEVRPQVESGSIASSAAALDRTALVPVAHMATQGRQRLATPIEIAALKRLMAQHIGPIAPMIVDRLVGTEKSTRQAIRILAAAIPDEAGRAAFVSDAEREFGEER